MPRSLGGLAVALGVRGGEVALGRRRVDVVGAQVDVVVGQHAARILAAACLGSGAPYASALGAGLAPPAWPPRAR